MNYLDFGKYTPFPCEGCVYYDECFICIIDEQIITACEMGFY